MNELELWALGLMTLGLGPRLEWSPAPPDVHQRRHDTFWRLVAAMFEAEPVDYDDLPEWMTEVASQALETNN